MPISLKSGLTWSGLLLISFFLHHCNLLADENEKQESIQKKPTSVVIDSLSGAAQKGPFLNGTAITASELDSTLNTTGKNYITQILDNSGAFNLGKVQLQSTLVQLMANGFYFNEIKGENSSAQLTLFAFSNLANRGSVNVNLLSHLEFRRCKHLIANGQSFAGAKQQAQSEVLAVFNIASADMPVSEAMDISRPGSENAALLAASVILQGQRSVSGLSSLLADMSADIEPDGKLDNNAIGSSLISQAKILSLPHIRKNLEDFYQSQNIPATIPAFESHVQNFIEKTAFTPVSLIIYPDSGRHGPNVLSEKVTSLPAGEYSFALVLKEGNSAKIKVMGGTWYYNISQDWSQFDRSDYNNAEASRTFTTLRTGKLEIHINFQGPSTTFLIYENGAQQPTRVHTVEFTGGHPMDPDKEKKPIM